MKISLGMEITYNLSNISDAATLLLSAEIQKKVVAFHGEMGAGKTTLIHELCRQLKIRNNVSSPTFSIINEYLADNGMIIYHMDLYRIKDEREAIDAGVEECFFTGRMCLVEWPDRTPKLLPADTVHCFLLPLGGNSRKLQIKL